MIETRAPGKLFILGEYAVVEPGHAAVLVAVDRCITVRLTPARDGESGVSLEAVSPHVRAAIGVVEALRAHRNLPHRPFQVHITSELEDESGRKYGLGSSAAVTVAVITAVLTHYGIAHHDRERFQLALLATLEVSPRASGGDLAASVTGGWVRYVSPDRAVLAAVHAEHGLSAALAHEAWKTCVVERLPTPTSLRLLVGWTGEPASTESLVGQVAAAGDSAAPTNSPTNSTNIGGTTRTEQSTKQSTDREARPQRDTFLADSDACVERFVTALRADDAQAMQREVTRARSLLATLAAASGITIETSELKDLCEIAERHGAAAKPSGAGGGDCGIVLAGAHVDAGRLASDWLQHQIIPLDLRVTDTHGTTEGGTHGN